MKDTQHNCQRFEDTKGMSRSRQSKDRPYNGQAFEETKEVIRIRKSKDRQYNGQRFEDTKGMIRSVNRRTDFTMAKHLKKPRK